MNKINKMSHRYNVVKGIPRIVDPTTMRKSEASSSHSP